MLTIESTRLCGVTPRILLMLEELGEPYELTLRPEDHFQQTIGRPGPVIHDDGRLLERGPAAFFHLARSRGQGRLIPAERSAEIEAWVQRAWDAFGLTWVAYITAKRKGEDSSGPAEKIRAALGDLERVLSDREYVAHDFSAADCALAVVSRFGAHFDLSPFVAVRRYASRLAERPAFVRAKRAQAGIASPDAVLSYWFSAPARTEEEVDAKLRRWFLAGRALDTEIGALFSATVEAALAGQLSDWASTPRGALALIVVLDQLTRHVHRDTATAHAGDSEAVVLAETAIGRGDLGRLEETVERLFLCMPLLHSEGAAQQQRYAEIVEQLAVTAGPLYQKMIASSREQSQKYRAIVERFGRFPHRNAVLGRASTAEEEAFLLDFAKKMPPEHARRLMQAAS
jgi:uncharacterized protein (DUF924 family)/glutathione S-transferase